MNRTYTLVITILAAVMFAVLAYLVVDGALGVTSALFALIFMAVVLGGLAFAGRRSGR